MGVDFYDNKLLVTTKCTTQVRLYVFYFNTPSYATENKKNIVLKGCERVVRQRNIEKCSCS